jgi:hypothetical protein
MLTLGSGSRDPVPLTPVTAGGVLGGLGLL